MAKATEQLINEVRLFYHSLIQVGDEIHRGSSISMGMRAVLEFLDKNGDTTVPQMARARRVTRQRIQTLVNSLFDLNLAKSISNPASKRSPLIAITPKGARTILEMRKLEGQELRFDLDQNRVKEASETIALLRASLEERHMK